MQSHEQSQNYFNPRNQTNTNQDLTLEMGTNNFNNSNLNMMANQQYGLNPAVVQAQMGNQNAMGMGMGVGVGGMGMMGMGMGMGMGVGAMPVDPRRFCFVGDQITYKVRADGLGEGELQSVTEAFIFVTGKQASQGSVMCILCTIIWGAFLILPLFAMCFDCWKKCAYASYEVSTDFYSSLARFTQRNLQSLTVVVKDNNFDRSKAQILYQIVSSQPNLIGFTFINLAQAYDYNSNEYSGFESNMKQFKKLPMLTDLRWFRQVVTP